jgi:hypothetical protein
MLRVCFLLLLVVLLPWRGAVAAAMLCPPALAPGHHSQHAADDGQADHEHHHHVRDHHGDMSDAEAPGSPPDHASHDTAQDGTCNLCAATCSVTTLPVHAEGVPAPPEVACTRFPPLAAPVPDFLSSGQDRPPRSI